MPDGNFPIDLNDAQQQRPDLQLHDLDDLKRRLADRAAEIYPRLFPHGRISNDRRELRMANIHGDAPRGEGSCIIELCGRYAGCIRDWSTDERGDQLDAIGYATGLEGRALFEYAARLVGDATPAIAKRKVNGHANGHDKAAVEEIKTALMVEDIMSGCVPPAGTKGETYFQARGLDLPETEDVWFHPDLTEWTGSNVGYSWPGIVSIIRNPVTGEETGGIHRIFLAHDGSGKAPIEKPKRCLGPSKGVIKLAEMAEDGTLGIAEGVESALAAMTIFAVPAWSGVSATGVRDFAFPPGLKRLLIFGDRDEAGQKAAETLRRRAFQANIEAIVVWPKSDDDFAEDLKLGYCAQDYQLEPDKQDDPQPERLAEPEIIPPPQTLEALLASIPTLSRDGSIEPINAVVRNLAIADLDTLANERVLSAIKSQTGLGIERLRQALKVCHSDIARQKRATGIRVQWLNIGSDVEIAGRVAGDLSQEFGEVVFDEGDFWRYVGTHWEAIDQNAARLAVHRYDGAPYHTPTGEAVVQLSKGRVNSVLNEMGAKLAQRDFFAEAPAGINCASGFIEFDSRGNPNLRDHSPKYRCRHVLLGRWLPETDGENPPPESMLGQLLDGIFKGDADAPQKRKLLAEVAGAAAVGYGPKLREAKAIVEVGETAGNGKSAVLDALRSLLPKTAVASVSANKFGDERFVVGLVGKLLNATDELSGAAVASEIFKIVITGQPVQGRDVYRSVVEFRPVAQHIFATNRLPRFTDGMDRGVQRRLLPLTFNRVIPKQERVENIGLRIAEEEPDLLLAFAVAGAQRLIRQRDFTIPASSKEALQQWIYRDNPVLAWVEARVEAAGAPLPGQKVVGIKSSLAYKMFHDWALEEGFAERGLPDIKGFVQRLKENEHVPDITVRHTKAGNFLVGLKILAQDRDPAAEGIEEMPRPCGVNLNKGEGWPWR
jgi:phage/plasmid-associated DNA primase